MEEMQSYQLFSNLKPTDLGRSYVSNLSPPQRNPYNQESPPSSSNTDPPQRDVVGIFSRSSSEDYSWLVELLKSKKTIIEVRPCYISNNGFQFMDDLSQCTFGILYHTKNRGRVNITNVTDSLYDEELENLNKILGKDNVIVVVDDLEDSSEQEKSRILENQPRIEEWASDILLISQTQKADTRELERILESVKRFCHPSGYPPPLSNIDPSDQGRSGHPSISSPTPAQRLPQNKGFPQPLFNIDPSDQYRSGNPYISSPTHTQREPQNIGFPQPLSNIDPSGQDRSGHPSISSPTPAQRMPQNKGFPQPLYNIDPSDQDRSGHPSISSPTPAQRRPQNKGFPQPLYNIDPSEQDRSAHPSISSPTPAQRRPQNKGYPQPLSNINPSGQDRSGHPSISSPTPAQRMPQNIDNFSKQSRQDQRPKELNEETSAPTKPTISVFSISEEGHIDWLRRLLSSDIFGHQHVTFHSISIDDKGDLRDMEFQCEVTVLYHTMKSGEFPTTPRGESLYRKVLQQMSEKLGKGNVVMIIDDIQAKELLRLKKIISEIERLAEDLCPISPKDKDDEMKLVQILKKVRQFRHMSEHSHKVDLAPQTSKTVNTPQKTPTSQGSIIGVFSVSEEGHIDWLRKMMSSDMFGQREVTYHKMPSYDNVGLEDGKLQCVVAILYHNMKTGKVVTSQGEFLYQKATDQLVEKLGKDNVIVMIDDLQCYTDKKWATCVQSRIEKWAGDLLYFLQEEKRNRTALVQKLKSLKLFHQPQEYLPNENTVQPAPGKSYTISSPASSVIGVFSCSEKSKFSWLDRHLSSKEFGNHQVIFHQICPGNVKEFHSMVSYCKFGILYHCMEWGYKPLTDLDNSLYDEELKYLSTTLGKSRVIVMVDELGNSNKEAKSWTLENQPSLGMLARDVLLFSKQENTHQENPNRSAHVDRNLDTLYEKLNTIKEILKDGMISA
ncbi:uncharacterized protein LOC120942951 isoform X2 [Rana temporaria]|uniref:uncharacterized protein LOC120942951 isoform X2 n=1 Tax=Rana temporaria TaxID=8407 RepID=UPI001AACCC5C|nr:uncharacterized protein LOC120942951 isoform X2 [Rana temporaria]